MNVRVFDAVSTNAYAWLVAKGPPQLGTNYQGGAVLYRRLAWTNGTAVLIDTNWNTVEQSSAVNYRDYFDIEGTNLVTLIGDSTVQAPQVGGSGRIAIFYVGSRLMNAVVRNGFLYTCQQIGLSGTNGTYEGDETGTNVDRSAIQWLKARVEPSGSLSYYKHGRIYDSAATNMQYYYFPSIAVNCASDMLLGFSGSSATNFINAYYAWQPAAGTNSDAPILIHAGDAYFSFDRWGDYSFTSVDPDDEQTFWTVQEYVSSDQNGFPPNWATWIARLKSDH